MTNRPKASIYMRRDRLIIGRIDTTTDGIGVGPLSPQILGVHVAAAQLGSVVLEAVRQSLQGITPLRQEDWKANLDVILNAAGVRSWRTFVRGCKEVSVTRLGDWLEFQPMINGGAREGFRPLPDSLFRTQGDDPRVVGMTVQEALARAEDWQYR